MKKLLLVITLSLLISPAVSFANMGKNTVSITAEPAGELSANKTTNIKVKLKEIESGAAVGEKDLQIAHTRKLHLLVIDSTLTDYQHIHPAGTNVDGEFSFDFTPKKDESYRVWADVMPVKTNAHEYTFTDIGKSNADSAIDKTTNMEAAVDGYKFKLLFDSPLTAGKASLGTIKVEDAQGKEVTTLEPVMGAFAHIVAFGEDHNSVLHVHPMGKEPETDAERGGPQLEFHIEPESAGFIKLFAQVKINGKDIFAPFGLMVENVVASK